MERACEDETDGYLVLPARPYRLSAVMWGTGGVPLSWQVRA